MVKELVHDPIFLGCASDEATKADLPTVYDLRDTLLAHKESCVGMAANMIGVKKRVIVCLDADGRYLTMLNPVIVKKEKPYDAEESCLSLLGGPRPCRRYQKIQVQYQSADMKKHTRSFSGWTAQIIQHEIDHCNGVLI